MNEAATGTPPAWYSDLIDGQGESAGLSSALRTALLIATHGAAVDEEARARARAEVDRAAAQQQAAEEAARLETQRIASQKAQHAAGVTAATEQAWVGLAISFFGALVNPFGITTVIGIVKSHRARRVFEPGDDVGWARAVSIGGIVVGAYNSLAGLVLTLMIVASWVQR